MENEMTSQPQSKSKMLPITITIAVVAIVIIAVAALTMGNNTNQTAEAPTPTQTEAMENTTEEAMIPAYKDGEYEAVGMYTSPGGEESIDVTLTLVEGVVTEATVESNATRPISKQMQEAFIGGFREQVIGKNIDEINLTKVSTSSLAPKGFNDALEKIKAQAQA